MNAEALDPAALRSLLEDLGAADLKALIDAFFQFTPPLIETMEAGIRDRNREAINRAAHTLKSNAAMMGAGSLAELCAQLESDAATAAWQDLEQRIAVARQLLTAATAALREQCSRLNRG